MLHLPHLAHVLHPYGTLRLSLQFCAPLVFLHSLSLLMTCGVWQGQDKAIRGCILDHFRRICYADASKINDVIFALGSSHDTSTHRAFYLIALIIVFNSRPNPPITPKSLLPHVQYITLTLWRRLTMSDTQGSAAVAVPPAQFAILRSDYANCTAQQNEQIPSKGRALPLSFLMRCNIFFNCSP